jgi:hypothetical protein
MASPVIVQLVVSTNNAVDIATAPYQVISSVADVDETRLCFLYLNLELLTGVAGALTVDVSVGGYTNTVITGDYYFTAETTIRVQTANFIVRSNETVTVTVQSDQAGDTSVNVITYIMDANPITV